MKGLFLTDLHFGIYPDLNLIDYQMSTLNRIIEEESPDIVVIGGDIFHYRNPRAETLLQVKNFFNSIKGVRETLLLRGNHDTINKSGAIDSSLSLVAHCEDVFVKNEITNLFFTKFENTMFLPHAEDVKETERFIKENLNDHIKYIFGHFAYKGEAIHPDAHVGDCIDPNVLFDTNIPVFLGHIHHPSDLKNIHVVGTQYSVSFGEANESKRYMVFDETGSWDYRPVNFGIKHIKGDFSFVEEEITQNKDFSLLVRVEIDSLDNAYQQEVKEAIMAFDNVLMCDIRVIDHEITPNIKSLDRDITSIDAGVIQEYIDNNPLDGYTKEELMETYKEIEDAVKESRDT